MNGKELRLEQQELLKKMAEQMADIQKKVEELHSRMDEFACKGAKAKGGKGAK